MGAFDHYLRVRFRARRRGQSAQATVEMALVLLLLMLLVFGMTEFFHASSAKQIIQNVSREGANLASRGTPFRTTLDALVQSAKPLNIESNGCIILTAVKRDGSGSLAVSSQQLRGAFPAESRVGSPGGGSVTLPTNALPLTNQTLYVAEVFYPIQSMTSVDKLLGQSWTRVLYDVAFF